MGNSSKTILIIDDKQDNLRLLVNILKNQHFTVRPIRNAYQGLMIAQQEMPDLILLDIKMPEIDGYEVCRRLKEDEITRHIPVIFLSALDDAIDKVQAFQVGGIDYVSKPFVEIELVARIETHLNLRQLQQTLENSNETLEEKVRIRTAELAETNQQLQTEIERRIRHQQEKDNLFQVVSQQSDQLRNLTTLLIQTQQSVRQGLAVDLHQEIARKIELSQSNITLARQLLSVDKPALVTQHLDIAVQLLTQMQQYIIQVTSNLPQPTPHEQDISENPLVKLSGREREVLQLLVQGKSNNEIGDLLNIAVASVYTYNRRIKDKLDLHDTPSLIKFALDHKLVK